MPEAGEDGMAPVLAGQKAAGSGWKGRSLAQHAALSSRRPSGSSKTVGACGGALRRKVSVELDFACNVVLRGWAAGTAGCSTKRKRPHSACVRAWREADGSALAHLQQTTA